MGFFDLWRMPDINTGLEQYDYLKEQMGDRLHYLSGGMTLTL